VKPCACSTKTLASASISRRKGQATGLDDNGFAGPMDPRPYWTKHEDGAFVSAAVRVSAQRYFISIRIELH
jgi:hypothetical protein